MSPANHDIGNSLPDVFGGEVTLSAERASAYRGQFGADFWTTDIGAVRLLGLNSMLPGSGLDEEAEQEALVARHTSRFTSPNPKTPIARRAPCFPSIGIVGLGTFTRRPM